jgi:hypothetical protein
MRQTKKRIHVNQHVIRANAKTGENNPVLTIKMGKTNTYAHKVKILGDSEVIYSPDKPLSCGAKVWIETTSPILLNEDEEGKWVYMKGGGALLT